MSGDLSKNNLSKDIASAKDDIVDKWIKEYGLLTEDPVARKSTPSIRLKMRLASGHYVAFMESDVYEKYFSK